MSPEALNVYYSALDRRFHLWAGETPEKGKFDLILVDTCYLTAPFDDRPKARELLTLIRQGRVGQLKIPCLEVLSLDTSEALELLIAFYKEGIDLRCHYPSLQSRTEAGEPDAFFAQLLTLDAHLKQRKEQERSERQLAGIERARRAGAYKGRKKGTRESPEHFLQKPKNQRIAALLTQGLSTGKISLQERCSFSTVDKVRRYLQKGR